MNDLSVCLGANPHVPIVAHGAVMTRLLLGELPGQEENSSGPALVPGDTAQDS